MNTLIIHKALFLITRWVLCFFRTVIVLCRADDLGASDVMASSCFNYCQDHNKYPSINRCQGPLLPHPLPPPQPPHTRTLTYSPTHPPSIPPSLTPPLRLSLLVMIADALVSMPSCCSPSIFTCGAYSSFTTLPNTCGLLSNTCGPRCSNTVNCTKCSTGWTGGKCEKYITILLLLPLNHCPSSPLFIVQLRLMIFI